MQWYLDVLKKYAVFSGRARRKEFWMFVLFNFIAAVLAGILDNILHTTYSNQSTGIISTLYSLAVLLPGLGVAIRRMHDIGKSGWWILVSLIPVAGIIWYIVLAATEGQHGDNQYGADPKAAPEMVTPVQ
jgi:uncharacterized membrane protein YhaH (DUF805 family)